MATGRRAKSYWLQDQEKKAWQARIRQLKFELVEERASKRVGEPTKVAEPLPTPQPVSPETPQATETLPKTPKTLDLSAVDKSRLLLRRQSFGR